MAIYRMARITQEACFTPQSTERPWVADSLDRLEN